MINDFGVSHCDFLVALPFFAAAFVVVVSRTVGRVFESCGPFAGSIIVCVCAYVGVELSLALSVTFCGYDIGLAN